MRTNPRSASCRGGERRTRTRVRARPCLLAGLAVAVAGMPAGAQTLLDPLVPGGRVRFDLVPSFSSWHERYGLAGGEDVVEDLGADLTDPTGRTLFPGLAELEESVRALGDMPAYQARLGTTTADVTQDVSRVEAGLRLGVFDWLTVGGMVPLVKTRTAVDVSFRPYTGDGGLGLNPFRSGDTGVTGLLDGLDAAAAAAAARAETICSGGPGFECDQATALSLRTTSFLARTLSAYGASPFFPVLGSPVAASLDAALAALDADLVAAGLGGVGAAMVYADAPLDEAGLVGLPADGSSGYQTSPLSTFDGLWTLGDVELSADLRLLQRVPPTPSSAGWTLSGGVTVRLPTGKVDDPAVLLDVGSGDGQMDVEGRVDASVELGSRLAFRGALRYGVQQARTLLRRVAPHEQVLAPVALTRSVRWTPGDYRLLEASPRLRLTEELALAVDYRRFHKAEDTYELVAAGVEAEPVDVGLLARESEITLQEFAVGLRYSTVIAWRRGQAGTPVQVAARVVTAAGGSGGRTPRATAFELGLSLYRRLWGAR